MSAPTETAEGFFEAESPFGALAGFEPQDGGGDTTTKDRASALGADGDEFRHKDHNEQKSVSATYIPDGTVTTTLTIPAAGSVLNGWVVDRVALAYSQEFPVLTIDGHKRTKVVTGALANMRTYSPTIDLPYVELGVPDQIGPLKCEGARSVTYELACTHVPEVGGQDYLVGANNHDGVETLTAESVCALTIDSTFEDKDEWTDTSKGKNKSNSAATVNQMTLVRHVAHDVASGSGS